MNSNHWLMIRVHRIEVKPSVSNQATSVYRSNKDVTMSSAATNVAMANMQPLFLNIYAPLSVLPGRV